MTFKSFSLDCSALSVVESLMSISYLIKFLIKLFTKFLAVVSSTTFETFKDF